MIPSWHNSLGGDVLTTGEQMNGAGMGRTLCVQGGLCVCITVYQQIVGWAGMNHLSNQKKMTKITEFSKSLSMVILNGNGLNSSVKRCRVAAFQHLRATSQ